MKLSTFKFNLPKQLIADKPVSERDEARMMVIHRDTGQIEHKLFKDIVDYFDEGDLLVLNDSKVFPARLTGYKEQGGDAIEVLLLRELDEENHRWDTLVDPARKIRVTNKIYFGDVDLMAEVDDNTTSRGRTLKFAFDGPTEELYKVFEELGETPLPEELGRKAEAMDKERYQTLYAKQVGGVVAPFAGLHFSRYVMKSLELNGVHMLPITMHLGMGMLSPIEVEDLTKYRPSSEYFSIPAATQQCVNEVLAKKQRVCAVGASTVRVLEDAVSSDNQLQSKSGWTNKFIFPPFDFKICNALVTNFHLPGSLLQMNAMAFGGAELMMEAYAEAIKEEYRFFVYGDAMLIL